MLLRKVEVHGFKSFADRSEIELGPGITAVVGPNGSGKSNVSDAIRWALGEQSIRNLRGTKTEDVIFAGSVKRRPLGAAEVSLIFDNSDNALPIDFSEVTITRRAFRSGESEYYINKSLCRLKDIHDLLADTGLGRDALTVIGQNKIDEMLNARPEERRLVFEEAAGITKYKYRKREALRKLEDTQRNLTRVQDLKSEIEGQLDPLAESAQRTAKYNQLQEQLTSCQVTLLLERLEVAEAKSTASEQEKTVLIEQELAASTQLSLLETDRERLTGELERKEQSLNQINEALNQTATEMERSEGRLALLKERVAQSRRDQERITAELASLFQSKESTQQKIGDLKKNYADSQENYDKCLQQLNELLAREQALDQLIIQHETALKTANEEIFEHMQELVNERNNYRMAERELANHMTKLAGQEKERARYVEELEQTGAELKKLINEKSDFQQEQTNLTGKTHKLRQAQSETQDGMNELLTKERDLNRRVEALVSKKQVLLAMQSEFEGFSRSTKMVLKSTESWSKGICGGVAHLFTVANEYITAIEIALGGSLQHVVTETDETAKQAIQFLKDKQLGRTTFLPLNTIRPVKPKENEIAAARSPGAIGFAAELIQFDPKFASVAQYLLGRTIIVKDIDCALRIARQNSFSLKLVTLEGELINPGGAISGGSHTRREASILGRQNEIDAIQRETVKVQDELQKIRNLLERQETTKRQLEAELSEVMQNQQNLEIKLAELAVHIEKLHADIAKNKFAITTIDNEISGGACDKSAFEQRMQESEQRISRMQASDLEQKDKLTALQRALKENKETRALLTETVTQKRIEESTLKQQRAAFADEIAKSEQAGTDLSGQLTRLQEQQRQTADTEETLIKEAAEEENCQASRISQKVSYEKERDEIYNQKLEVLARIQKSDKETKELRRKVQSFQVRLHEIELAAANYSHDVKYCLEQLNTRHLISREQALTIRRAENAQELADLIYHFETEIYQLGAINPAAIDEYARMKERYDFLETQSTDLISAKEYLLSIIAEMDATMSKQFKSAFETINQYFQDTFIRLFGGGQASLQLLEPEKILESGIEITVQPPGKKQQNLSLLSGGERALTVIALLFAFLTYRPTPFCVVDEIDAALDEANVQRFSEFLRDYAQKTQFVVVTHRKGTMEVADVLIGITMEESGISKLLSVQFMDKAG